jgi:hypothetical protein
MKAALLNRMILRYLADQVGIPQRESEIAEHVSARCFRPMEAETGLALANLRTARLVANPESQIAASEPSFELTEAGLLQINKQVHPSKLHAMVWGD